MAERALTEAPAETLRCAAKLMRERAEAAMCAPWMTRGADADIYVVSPDGQVGTIERTPVEGGWGDAEHIASWHPGVALTVADLLDDEAEWAETAPSHKHFPYLDHVMAIARTYLAEPQP